MQSFASRARAGTNLFPRSRLSPPMKVYALMVGAGALSMFLFGRVLAWTQGCSGFCDPAVSTSFGAFAGLLAARMIRTA